MPKATKSSTSADPTALVPNRAADVDAICRAHPEAFPPGDANDPARLKLLTETMVPQINRDHPEDGGNWGVLTKTDQGNKIPCDVMVWRPGTVTIDVMTGTGASWDVHGAANNPLWVWTAVSAPGSGGGSQTHPAEYDPDHEQKAIQFGTACNAVYADPARVPAGAAPDAGMIAVHAMRCEHTWASGVPWDEAFTKHVNEFRAVYGLPPWDEAFTKHVNEFRAVYGLPPV